jgi:hypothetical protein
METEEKMMTGEESIRIITEMLNKTRVNIRQGIFHLLLWGWMIIICSLGEYILDRYTGFTKPWLIWMLVIPGMFVSMIYGMVNGRRAKIHTYADKIWMWTWFSYLFAMFVLFTIQSGSMGTISAYILLLTGIPTFISGMIIRFRPLIIGGICFWVFALVVAFAGPVIGPLGVPLSMIAGYLIPGYILKNRVDHGTI